MSTTSEIVNSVFDWRSTGKIIMDFWESMEEEVSEEWKSKFDLVVKEMDEKIEQSGIYGCKYECPRRCECVKARDWPLQDTTIRRELNWVYKMKNLVYTPEENEQLIVTLYTNMVNEGYYAKVQSQDPGRKLFPEDIVPVLLTKFVKTQEYHPLVLKCFSTLKKYALQKCLYYDFIIYSRHNNPSLFEGIDESLYC